MVSSSLLTVPITRKEEWRFVSTKSGAQCVMITGEPVMQKLSAHNLGSHLGVGAYRIRKL